MAEDNRTEKATPKKREDERKKGNIFQSKEITNVFGLLIIIYSLRLLAPFYYRYFQETLAFYFDSLSVHKTFTSNQIGSIISDMVIRIIILAVPIALIAALSATVFSLAQTRLNVSKEQIRFKISRLNLLNGLRNFISIKTIVELLKSIIKITGIGIVLYTNILNRLPQMIRLINTNTEEAVYFIADAIFSTVIGICIIMTVFAVLDYLYQWWDYERRMRMTKQEVKDEYKQIEGDPQVKSRIRERQRSMAQARMMQQIPEADFVVRNPTHYAVAIKYDPEKNNAPVVLAKGQGYVALKIIEVAEQHEITVIENKPLAQGLYQAVELNHEIPAQFYQAVAELLAFVYKLRKEKRYEV